MRVHIYQEEVGSPEVELISTVSKNGKLFFGLRIWLRTCRESIIRRRRMTDRSAVTFWSDDREKLYELAIAIGNAALT